MKMDMEGKGRLGHLAKGWLWNLIGTCCCRLLDEMLRIDFGCCCAVKGMFFMVFSELVSIVDILTQFDINRALKTGPILRALQKEI